MRAFLYVDISRHREICSLVMAAKSMASCIVFHKLDCKSYKLDYVIFKNHATIYPLYINIFRT